MSEKPLGRKAYGSIPHLPGSARGYGDYGVSDEQARICLTKSRHDDRITVQEKLDGSNVAVANIGGSIVPLIRAGYRADESNWRQHHVFHVWAIERMALFQRLLEPGERLVGEWLWQAHGTRYDLRGRSPFVGFDIMSGQLHREQRVPSADVAFRCSEVGIDTPNTLHVGPAISVKEILPMLERSGHGALDQVEGAVWRVESGGKVLFLAKYVRPEKKIGAYLPEQTAEEIVLNR